MKKIRAIVIGAGGRGFAYVYYMSFLRDKYQVVAVADPSEPQRRSVQEMWGFSEENCFHDWQEILSKPKMADVAIIATLDDMHREPALAAIEKGYDILLEKPVAQTAQECVDIALAAEKKGVKVLVCHVLRYAPFFVRVKELLRSGIIGKPMTINMVEAVGDNHYSRSYIRGKWHSEKESTPMLLAKCCHDLDCIQWFIEEPCEKVQSFGELTYFREENAPEGAPVRCADGGCPVGDTCPYDCMKIYYNDKTKVAWRNQITRGSTKEYDATDEEVMYALKTTDYGLCVFHANNDVVDHQTVNMYFRGGATATLTMNAFNKGGRYVRIYGTKGELHAYASADEIEVYTFADEKTQNIPVKATIESIDGGHGGGDKGIVEELYDYLNGTYTGFQAADIMTSVKNHLIGFAAEEARRSDTVVDLNEFFKQYNMKNEYT